MKRIVQFVALVALWPSLARADPPSFLSRNIVSAAIRHAVEHAGLDPSLSRELSSRARASAWLPDFTFRVLRGMGGIAVESYSAVDRTTDDDSLALDVRVQWQLNHTVFHPSEVAIQRNEMRRADHRETLEREVVDVLATLEETRNTLANVTEGTPAAAHCLVDFRRARARIEALTGVSVEDLLRSR